MNTLNEDYKADEDYMKEVLKELGIDLDKPKRKSKLPTNRLGLHVIPKGSAGLLQLYWEEHGLY